MGTYQLICEGACNPTIGAVDALGAKFLATKQRGGDPVLFLAAHRSLIYTPHTATSDGMYAVCDVCGCRRGYGTRPLRGGL